MAAFAAMRLLPTMFVLALCNRSSPSLGVSLTPALPAAPRLRWSTTEGGREERAERESITASASWYEEVSHTVGPEAMTSSGSPTTSDSTSPTTVAGYAAAASCPPLTSDRCLRTVFSCCIEAPARTSALVAASLSASEIPATGSVSKAEPPPLTSTIIVSPSPAFVASSTAFVVPDSEPSSGMFPAAPVTISDLNPSCFASSLDWQMTTPPRSTSPSFFSAPRAIRKLALPKAMR
mmetsp:Transcript_13307/g.31649  ORF Transcript_13307/g.31649 Transcript_13307/m.31649 type:complete len:236 (-) Transcript_13307:309-1016(-)